MTIGGVENIMCTPTFHIASIIFISEMLVKIYIWVGNRLCQLSVQLIHLGSHKMPVKARRSFHMQVRFIEREGLPNPLTASSLNIDTSEYSMIFRENPCPNVTLADSGKGWLEAEGLFHWSSSESCKRLISKLKAGFRSRIHSHLWFIRRELLRVLFAK